MAHSLAIFENRLRNELTQTRQAILDSCLASEQDTKHKIASELTKLNYSNWPEYLEQHFIITGEPKIQRLIELEAAIAQFEIGQYGFCADCEAPLQLSSLNENPALQRCEKCESLHK